MKSKMVNCYDYSQLNVPEELGRWHIPDSEIEAELQALAKDHSGEEIVESEIEEGDSVRCICTEASKESWKDRVVLLYPGRKLPGAEKAEEEVIGKKAGEELNCSIRDVELCLMIEQVIRIHEQKVNDELTGMLNIPGVQTVEDYYRWYHEQHDGERKEKAKIAVSRFWLEEISMRSEFDIDKEEKDKWCSDRARIMYDGMLAAGHDLKKTPDGKIISEEEALKRTAESQEIYFIPYIIYCYFCEKDGFAVTEKDFVKTIEQMAVERGEKVEDLMKQADITLYREKEYQQHTYDLLMADAEKYLEV